MILRKTHLAAAVGAALLAGGTAVQAQNLQVQLYGQVNRAMMWVDDDTQNKWFHVDGQPSSTRFGIQGTADIGGGLRAGARIESEMKSNPSNVVTFANASQGAVGGNVLFAERWLDAFFEGSWGRINIGQGSAAADDASTIDLSGTAIANGVCICDWAGAINFRSNGVVLAGVTPNSTIDNLDFESRYDRIQYTTPVFGGLRAQVSYGQRTGTGEGTEASLWYSGKLMGDFQAAIGYAKVSADGTITGDRETVGGSVSWLHTSGFNITGAYTTRDFNVQNRDISHWYIKPGYKFGPHAVSFGYYQGDDQFANGTKMNAYALSYVWNPVRWAEVYATYLMYKGDTDLGIEIDDMTVGVIGTRIRF